MQSKPRKPPPPQQQGRVRVAVLIAVIGLACVLVPLFLWGIGSRYWPTAAMLSSLVLSLMLVWKLPEWQVYPLQGTTEAKDIINTKNELRRTVAQIIGGGLVLAGLLATWSTIYVSRDGQVTERFSKAIEHLGKAGNENLPIRIGGIYELERIAKDSERDHWTIMEVLTAFVRENSPRGKESAMESQLATPNADRLDRVGADIQAILTVIGRRDESYGTGERYQIDLSGTNLALADLHYATLENAILKRADLTCVDAYNGNFARSDLTSANLRAAWLSESYLRGLILEHADLTGELNCRGSKRTANFDRVDLNDAKMMYATLSGASFSGSALENADLTGAIAKGASFEGAYFKGAVLKDVVLEGANLLNANALTIEQLSTVKTLYRATLNPELMESIKAKHPSLLMDLNDK